jgi:hypothetical protein
MVSPHTAAASIPSAVYRRRARHRRAVDRIDLLPQQVLGFVWTALSVASRQRDDDRSENGHHHHPRWHRLAIRTLADTAQPTPPSGAHKSRFRYEQAQPAAGIPPQAKTGAAAGPGHCSAVVRLCAKTKRLAGTRDCERQAEMGHHSRRHAGNEWRMPVVRPKPGARGEAGAGDLWRNRSVAILCRRIAKVWLGGS